MVGAYHVPIQLVLQNKDDEDIGLLFQGVCMYVCMCVCVCMYVMYVCMYVCVCLCLYM